MPSYLYDRDHDVMLRYDKTSGTWIPTSEPQTPRVQAPPHQSDIEPAQLVDPTSVTQVTLRTTYEDRAKGFRLVIMPLSWVLAGLSVIVGVGGFQVPLFSLPILMWFGTAYALTWLGGWLVHMIISPEGIALVHTLLGWRYLRREQQARLRRYRSLE